MHDEHAERLVRVETLLESLRDDYLEEIRTQTKKTNGRVDALESKVGDIRTAAARVGVRMNVLWSVGAAILLFIAAAVEQHITTDKLTDLQQIQQSAR